MPKDKKKGDHHDHHDDHEDSGRYHEKKAHWEGHVEQFDDHLSETTEMAEMRYNEEENKRLVHERTRIQRELQEHEEKQQEKGVMNSKDNVKAAAEAMREEQELAAHLILEERQKLQKHHFKKEKKRLKHNEKIEKEVEHEVLQRDQAINDLYDKLSTYETHKFKRLVKDGVAIEFAEEDTKIHRLLKSRSSSSGSSDKKKKKKKNKHRLGRKVIDNPQKAMHIIGFEEEGGHMGRHHGKHGKHDKHHGGPKGKHHKIKVHWEGKSPFKKSYKHAPKHGGGTGRYRRHSGSSSSHSGGKKHKKGGKKGKGHSRSRSHSNDSNEHGIHSKSSIGMQHDVVDHTMASGLGGGTAMNALMGSHNASMAIASENHDYYDGYNNMKHKDKYGFKDGKKGKGKGGKSRSGSKEKDHKGGKDGKKGKGKDGIKVSSSEVHQEACVDCTIF